MSFAHAQTVCSLSAEQPDRCDAVGDQQTGKHAHTQAAMQAHTNELKDKRGYLGMGWGIQPQQFAYHSENDVLKVVLKRKASL